MTSIRYKSTRGGEVGICFEEVVLGGLGKDRGLFVPEYLPKFIDSEIEQVFENDINPKQFRSIMIIL